MDSAMPEGNWIFAVVTEIVILFAANLAQSGV
jgi:hypothetical protein